MDKIIVLIIFSCDEEPTIPQVHYYHDNSTICARFCYLHHRRAALRIFTIFAELRDKAQIDAHNPDSAVHNGARCDAANAEAEEMQRAGNEKSEQALACVDTVSQHSENGCLARIRT